jgi:uncharacterized membrane protein (DUF373 family)
MLRGDGTYQQSTATGTFRNGMTMSGGTFTGAAGGVTLGGNFTMSGGTFTGAAGGGINVHDLLARVFIRGVKGVISLLIMAILLALLGGVVKTFIDLHGMLTHPLQQALRQVILDVLILLAMIEIFRTILSYYTEGRVKVTFIVDAILVVMLTELLSLWFGEPTLTQVGLVLGVLAVLGGLRVLAIRFSPGDHAPEEGEGERRRVSLP